LDVRAKFETDNSLLTRPFSSRKPGLTDCALSRQFLSMLCFEKRGASLLGRLIARFAQIPFCKTQHHRKVPPNALEVTVDAAKSAWLSIKNFQER
jgi:hypothetical protein